VNCPKCGEDWSDVAVVRNAKREALAATPAPLPCLKPDFGGDDCRFWAKTYGQEPCANCAKRYDLAATPAPLAAPTPDEITLPDAWQAGYDSGYREAQEDIAAATPAPLDVERLARALLEMAASHLSDDERAEVIAIALPTGSPDELAAAIAAAYAEEKE
jgi:hypothetical protein